MLIKEIKFKKQQLGFNLSFTLESKEKYDWLLKTYSQADEEQMTLIDDGIDPYRCAL